MAGIVAAVVGVAGVAGSTASSMSASKNAASQQANASRQALDFQKQVYGTTVSNLAPFVNTGTNALGAISQFYGLPNPTGAAGGNALDAYTAFTNTPFYQFQLGQGQDTLNRQAASKGLSLSGGQLASLDKYSQGYASSNFNNYIAGLASLANLGQNSAVGQGSQGNTAAGNVTGIQNSIGNALAAGTVGSNNALSQGLGQLPALINNLAGSGSSNPSGSSFSNISSGIGNVLAGYQWDGMAGGSQLAGLSAQAAGNTAGGAAGL